MQQTVRNYKKDVIEVGKRLYKIIPSDWQSFIEIIRSRKRLIDRFEYKRLPSSIYLETTNACNLNCIMCPSQRSQAKKFKKDGFMDTQLFRRLIDEIASENPLAEVRLHKDGEPFLHPQIVDFIDYASCNLENVYIVTNGTLLSEEIARAILQTQLKIIRFSVDGITKQTFEKVRRQRKDNPYADPCIPVDYESVINNILRFCELKKSLGKHFPKVGVRITDFNATQQELSDYTSYWHDRVDFIEVSPLLSWSGQITQEESNQSHRYPCLNLWAQMVVNWEGTIAPCCIYINTTGDGKGSMGDLKNSTLRKAFYSPSIQRVRLAHLNNDLEEVAPFCKQCNDWRLPIPPGDKVWAGKFKEHMRLEASGRCSKSSTGFRIFTLLRP